MVQPTFQWRDASHGNSMQWHIWVEDSENEHVYHSETWTLTKKMMREPEHRLAFTIPIFEPLPPQYYIRWDATPASHSGPTAKWYKLAYDKLRDAARWHNRGHE